MIERRSSLKADNVDEYHIYIEMKMTQAIMKSTKYDAFLFDFRCK